MMMSNDWHDCMSIVVGGAFESRFERRLSSIEHLSAAYCMSL